MYYLPFKANPDIISWQKGMFQSKLFFVVQ